VQTFRATKKPALVKLGIANRPRSRTPRGAPDLSELSLVNRANSAGLTLFNICRIRKRFVPPAKSEFQPLRRVFRASRGRSQDHTWGKSRGAVESASKSRRDADVDFREVRTFLELMVVPRSKVADPEKPRLHRFISFIASRSSFRPGFCALFMQICARETAQWPRRWDSSNRNRNRPADGRRSLKTIKINRLSRM
jgi:hypothetical protein